MALRLDTTHKSILFYIGLNEDSEKLRVLRELAEKNFKMIEVPASRIHSRLDDILQEGLKKNKLNKNDRKFVLRGDLLSAAEGLVADKNFELILFYNFDKSEISAFLKKFKERTGERIALKAALTEYNLTLSILSLFRELFEEHTFVRNANILGMGIKLAEFRFPKDDYEEDDYAHFAKVLSDAKSYMAKISDPNSIAAGEEPKPGDPLKFFVNLMLASKKLDEIKYLGEEFQQRVFRDKESKNLVDTCEKNGVSDENIRLSNSTQKLIDELEDFENFIDEKNGSISNSDYDDDFEYEDFSTNPFAVEEKISDSKDGNDDKNEEKIIAEYEVSEKNDISDIKDNNNVDNAGETEDGAEYSPLSKEMETIFKELLRKKRSAPSRDDLDDDLNFDFTDEDELSDEESIDLAAYAILSQLIDENIPESAQIREKDPQLYAQMISYLKNSLVTQLQAVSDIDSKGINDDEDAYKKVEEAVDEIIKESDSVSKKKWEKIKKESKNKIKKTKSKVREKLFGREKDDEDEFSPYGQGNSPGNFNS